MRKFCGFIVLSLLMFGCANNEETISETDKPADQAKGTYLALKEGNYWVYEVVSKDTFGVERHITIDSVYIKGDTIINKNNYYKLKGTNYLHKMGGSPYYFNYLRDSSGYTVDFKGKKYIDTSSNIDSLSPYKRIIGNDTLYSLCRKCYTEPVNVTVPAGTFSAINNRSTVFDINKKYSSQKGPRYLNFYFVNGLGDIYGEEFYLQSPIKYIRRLIRYKIN